jgi:hypothetical protein
MGFVDLIQLVLSLLTALVGFPSLVSVLLVLGEKFGWISSSNVDAWNFGFTAVAFVGIFVAGLLGKIDLINQIDVSLGEISKILVLVLTLLGIPVSFSFTRFQNREIRSVRFLGFRDGVG